MSKTINLPIKEGVGIEAIVQVAEQQLRAQGFEVSSIVMSPTSGTMTVKKDRDGFKNIMGLGIECRATITMMGAGAVTINIDSEWTNKIIAVAVGWFLCLIPFITGIVGCVNQSGLPDKVANSLQTATSSF